MKDHGDFLDNILQGIPVYERPVRFKKVIVNEVKHEPKRT
jgi:hypothetical protein